MRVKSFVEALGSNKPSARSVTSALLAPRIFSNPYSTSAAWTPPIEIDTPDEIRKQFTVFQKENTIIPPRHLLKLCQATGKTPMEHFAPSPVRLAWQQLITACTGFQCDDAPEFHENTHKIWHHLSPVLPDVTASLTRHFEQQKEKVQMQLPSDPKERPTALKGILAHNFSLLNKRLEGGEVILSNPLYFQQVLITMTACDYYNLTARDTADKLLAEAIHNGAKREGIVPVPIHDRDNTAIFINGAPGSGKSVAWPYFRNAFEKKYDIPWRNFKKVNSDWWRPLLCDRDSLSEEAQPYYECITNDELCGMTLACYQDVFKEGKPNPHTVLEHPFPSTMLLHNALHGNKDDSPDHTKVKMVFFIVPPAEIVERVHRRAEEGNPYTRMGVGRYAPVQETLERYKNTLANDEHEFFQVLNHGRGHDVEVKILNKDVPLGTPPKPVLIGNLGTGKIDIYDVRTLMLMGKYSRIDVAATSPDELYDSYAKKMRNHTDFLDHFEHISDTLTFFDPKTKTAYAAVKDRDFLILDEEALNEKLRDPYYAFAFNRLSQGKIAPNASRMVEQHDMEKDSIRLT